ncbi:MAG TPA: ABC transporter permease [Synergistaceae bacterium]|nr:ABC transporter permease [Synergistaceae bacterium]HPJ25550.1 ABC transporter permease [Synergistaceae bacterium]HPQ37234.1 ABC transporter permease [Synergistaceae bacterium]
MNGIIHITPEQLGGGYLLLLIPLSVFLLKKVPIIRETGIAVIRMTVQLIFVGLYLQVVFRLNNPWLNLAWVGIMVGVADFSIIRGCGLRLSRFLFPVFIALAAGTLVPVFVFMGAILQRSNCLDAQYVIPLWGMILGNCLRADIIGLKNFYESLKKDEKLYLQSLAQGATLKEALDPYVREALQASLLPTVASMSTIGLVALPGMMTGVILAGVDPLTAISYQIAIMIAIFSGTTLTVFLALRLTLRRSFNSYGLLDPDVFRTK